MKFEKLIMAFVVLFLAANVIIAQSFVRGSDTFSHKKTVYITLNSGETVEGLLSDLDRKKGNIEEITIKKTGSKKKTKYEPADIKHMYLKPSGLDNLGKAYEFLNDARLWENNDLNSDLIKDGYAYFEQSEVKIKKKTRTLLMQLVNPSFEEKVRVYFDPWAKESMSIGVGPLKVGGIDKSYYVKNGSGPAYRAEKKNYKEVRADLFGDCDVKTEWSAFPNSVFKHAKECN